MNGLASLGLEEEISGFGGKLNFCNYDLGFCFLDLILVISGVGFCEQHCINIHRIIGTIVKNYKMTKALSQTPSV